MFFLGFLIYEFLKIRGPFDHQAGDKGVNGNDWDLGLPGWSAAPRFSEADFQWRHQAASEEPASECFMPLLGHIQQRGKFRIISQLVQQRIGCEIGITEESAFDAAAQGAERGSLVA